MFYQLFTNVLPMFYQCFTNILPIFYQYFTNVLLLFLPMFYQCCRGEFLAMLWLSAHPLITIPPPAARPTIGKTSHIFFYKFQIQWYEKSTIYENNVFLLHWKNSFIRFQNLILAILNQIKGIFHLLHNNCKAIPSKGLPSPSQMGPFHENIICLE